MILPPPGFAQPIPGARCEKCGESIGSGSLCAACLGMGYSLPYRRKAPIKSLQKCTK